MSLLAAFLYCSLRFTEDCRGAIAPMFGLALVPIIGLTGAAVDYSRANNVRTGLQASLDAAVLAGATDGGSQWADAAKKFFIGNVDSKGSTVGVPAFTTDGPQTYSGAVSAVVPTTFVTVLGFSSINVGVKASAKPGALRDDSCILTLDHGKSLSHESLTFDGSPDVNLSNCTVRSNTSLKCNGLPTGARALAAGTASGCSTTQSAVAVVPDIYASMAANIVPKCGGKKLGATWSPGVVPVGPMVEKLSTSTHTEYHICGDLTLKGTGFLTGDAPSSDTVIIIENGSLIVAQDASISTMRVAIVLTGNNKGPSSIQFPNGVGHIGGLSLSAPTTTGNPWRGVALYQDPTLTNVDNKWGPGATFNADGLVYLPNSNVVTSGNSASGKSSCTKIVANTFTTNGSVKLNFQQAAVGCAALGLKQWEGIEVVLIR